MESQETEWKQAVQEAVEEKRSAEDSAKLLQAQLQRKENELRRSQDEIEEVAKAANDAEGEARKLDEEKQGLLEASIALQMTQTELEDKAELMQKELNEAEAECAILRQVQEARIQEDHQKVVQRAGFIEDLSPALEQKGASEKWLLAHKVLEQEVAALKEGLEESRQRNHEMESQETEWKQAVQEAVEEKRSAEEGAKLLQAQLQRKENELRRSQDEIEEAAKAADDAQEEGRKLLSEASQLLHAQLQQKENELRRSQDELEEVAKAATDAEEARKATMAMQSDQTELEQEAELVQQEPSAVLSQQQHEQSAVQQAQAEASKLRLEMEDAQKVSESATVREDRLEAKVLKIQEDMFLSEGKHKEAQFEGRLEQHKFEEECLMLKKLLATSEQDFAARQGVSATARQDEIEEAVKAANDAQEEDRKLLSEASKLLQAQLQQKENELRRSQDEIKEVAKAANDAEGEARKLHEEKQGLLEASIALQMTQTELEDKAELMQKELNAAEAECAILRQVREARVQEDHQKVVQRAGFIEDLCPALEQKGASEKWLLAHKALEQEVAALKEGLDESRQRNHEMESQETEWKQAAQEAVEEKRSAEDSAKLLQAQLQRKENEVRRSQDEIEEAAKAANDAQEEARKAKMATQSDQTELEQEAELVQQEPSAVLSQRQHEESAVQQAQAEARKLRLEMEDAQKVSESATACEDRLEAKVLKIQEEMFLSEGKHKEAKFEGRLEQHKFEEECLTLKKLLATSEQDFAARQGVSATARQDEIEEAVKAANDAQEEDRKLLSEASKLLQAQLQQKENELRRSQDEIKEVAKAANDAEGEARKLHEEKQGLLEASIALQMTQTELEDKAELMQKELNAAEAECEILRQAQEARVQEDHQKVVQRAGFIEDLCPALEQKGASEKWLLAHKALEQEVAALKEGLDESRQRNHEMESQETEWKQAVQEAVEEKRSAEEAAKLLQAQLQRKENELRRSQDEIEEAAKAANDAQEEDRNLLSEASKLLQAQLQQKENELRRSQDEIEEVAKAATDAEEARKLLFEQQTELEHQTESMQQELFAAQEERASLQHTMEACEVQLRQELRDMTAQKAAAQKTAGERKGCRAVETKVVQTEEVSFCLVPQKEEPSPLWQQKAALELRLSAQSSELQAAQTALADHSEKTKNLEEALLKARFQHDKSTQKDQEDLAALREQIAVLERREQERQSAEARWERLGALGRQWLIFDERNPIDRSLTHTCRLGKKEA